VTDRELMQQALDALCTCTHSQKVAITALRARLAQPEEPDWSAAGFGKPPNQRDRQCPSCGGFCKKGCERENVQPEQQHSEQWWRHEVSNAWATGYEKGRASVKQPEPVAKVHVAEDYYPHVIWMEGINAVCFDQEYLYITPPQRDEAPAKAVEWQGLTMEEMDALVEEQSGWPVEMVGHVLICAAEAKLREKNA